MKKYPIDLVILHEKVSEHELEKEDPTEHERLLDEGCLETIRMDAPSLWLGLLGRITGFSVIATGFLLFGFTLLAFLTE